MAVTNESTLKELVNETGIIKNDLVSCRDNLKNNLEDLGVNSSGINLLSILINKVSELKSKVVTIPPWYSYDPYDKVYPLFCAETQKPSSMYSSPHIFYDEVSRKIVGWGGYSSSSGSTKFYPEYAFEYEVDSNKFTKITVTKQSGVYNAINNTKKQAVWFYDRCIFIFMYDPRKIFKYNTVTKVAEPLPWNDSYLRLGSITNIGDKYYSMSTEGGLFSELDPSSMLITQKPTRPSLTSEGHTTQDNIIGAMGDKVYSMGGSYYNSNFVIMDDEGLYVYDVKTNVWTLISYFLRGRCSYNDTIRAWNIDRGLMCIQVNSSIYMFDTKTNTYSFVKTLGKGYYYSTFCMTDKFAYLYSGKDVSSTSEGTSYDELWCQYLEVPYKIY